MACPFLKNPVTFSRQPSVNENIGWNPEDAIWIPEAEPDDALTLKHLNFAIQLLTAPSVS
jgi:hypothetical protein